MFQKVRVLELHLLTAGLTVMLFLTQVPIAMLLIHGPESGRLRKGAASGHQGMGRRRLSATAAGESKALSEGGGGRILASPATLCMLLAATTAVALLGLVAASDAVIGSAFPEERCLPLAAGWLGAALRNGGATVAAGSNVKAPAESATLEGAPPLSCWATHVYGLPLLFEDLTPNIGQWWYFFAQIFPQQRPFFAFVAHALCGLFAVPAALRFPCRGLLLAVLQLGASAMLRPYPSLGDLGLYLTLLLLLQPQLGCFKPTGLLLCNSLLLLSVLGPAMWSQWIDAESANSNFYYSITLLLGAWHTLLMVQLVLSTVDLEQHDEKQQQ